MQIKGFVRTGEYFDSVSLMIVSREVNAVEGIEDSAVVMGTNENKAIVKAASLYLPEFDNADDTDLLISLKAADDKAVEKALTRIDELFYEIRNRSDEGADFTPRSFEGALKQVPDANLSLISIAGKYAAKEAARALNAGLHVMLFSDNVSIEEELKLKETGRDKGLLVMGPDCGTAIINGVPLAFANVVNRGDIGVVAASGTGLQEVTSIISNRGGGISQAIGTGGRDVKAEIGGIMFLEALRALNEDPQTKVITLVSKPPHPTVLQKIADEIKKIDKPVAGIFIGGDPEILEKAGAIAGSTLEETAAIAVALSEGTSPKEVKEELASRGSDLDAIAEKAAGKVKGRYLRGLFSGGTLCDETQLILREQMGFMYSNAPLNEDYLLQDVWKSRENTILDLGEDEFTAGKPHPMIDFSLRNRRILEEAADPEVAVILLDLVLGFGSNMDPVAEFKPVFEEAQKTSPETVILCSITGTDGDPQNRSRVEAELKKAGAIIMSTNAEATELAGKILKLAGSN